MSDFVVYKEFKDIIMKKTKIIIPALGLLLLSTAASVTGTVAWFAANASVTANGMQITAKTESEFLVISKTSTLASATSVDLVHPSGEVLPTNWRKDGENVYHWVTGAGTATDNGTINTSGYTNLTIDEASVTNFGIASAKKYYVYDTVYVGLAVGSSTPANTKLLKCSATFTAGTASNLNKCLTIGLDAENDMGTAADLDERLVMGNDSSATVNGTATLLTGDQLSSDTAIAIKIYAFFNGDDTNCTTENAVDLDAITVNLTFTLA